MGCRALNALPMRQLTNIVGIKLGKIPPFFSTPKPTGPNIITHAVGIIFKATIRHHRMNTSHISLNLTLGIELFNHPSLGRRYRG